MSKFLFLIVALFVFHAGYALAGNGRDRDFSIVEPTNVPQAVEKITMALEDRGYNIIATLDHAAAAASVGLELRPTVVIMANKSYLESSLLYRETATAIDLPIKFLIFEDQNGSINLEVNDNGYLLDRHQIPIRDELLRKMDRAINQFGRNDNGVLTVNSAQSVPTTVSKLLAILADKGFRIAIPGGIDYQAQASMYGIYIPATHLLVFGNPLVGTPLMQNDQSIGLDLPQKFLVREDYYGNVTISFNAPRFLAKKHNLQRDMDPMLETRLTNITNTLTDLATSGGTP